VFSNAKLSAPDYSLTSNGYFHPTPSQSYVRSSTLTIRKTTENLHQYQSTPKRLQHTDTNDSSTLPPKVAWNHEFFLPKAKEIPEISKTISPTIQIPSSLNLSLLLKEAGPHSENSDQCHTTSALF